MLEAPRVCWGAHGLEGGMHPSWPCCPAQMSPILSAFLRLAPWRCSEKPTRRWEPSQDPSSGSGRALPGLLQDPRRREAGQGEPPRRRRCMCQLPVQMPGQGKRLV